MNQNEIKQFISILGFKPEESKDNIYLKLYNQYPIRVDFNSNLIDYGNKITLGDRTTSNFSKNENFVVLECVDKLLEKGYKPEKLTLEIKWDLGKKEKGKLDIYIADKDDDSKCFLMIECKTFGIEYEKEKKNMLSKGGQLFSYFQQDKSAKYLCLYTSTLNAGEIEYFTSIVEVNEDFRTASNKNETYSLWNKMFKDNGIFEDWANVYDIKSKALIRGKLKPLQQSDSGFIFNRFAEILRHNIVSDKSNAFNKIFNLFLCKIEDEDKAEKEELDFQWKENDNHISLQKRLNNLYKEGMRKFLSIEITDFSEIELEKELSSVSGISKKHIEDMFTKLRLYKNNEFAFKEVFDDTSFEENAIVLKEVVELLQPYQLRYTHKQQFLGDFFELLLNTGLKQESGQFFTPVPIAKFISSSIPLQKIIDKKITQGEVNFLPYVIDYAAGSGHFLTEAMDEIQHIINNMDHTKYKDSIKRKLRSFQEDTYGWAEEYMYGIEKDYRLVKTAKVACFLNGDGLANLIHADGLANFKSSSDYFGKLKSDNEDSNNQQFDIVIANPPYSVSAFKNTLKNGSKSFDLYKRLTDQSSEIECLFIERTKQLLKEDAYAGIVLPSSVLTNSGIHTQAREIILKYFDIKAIVELGANTFMATNTSTVTLFLKKKNDNHWIRVQESINEFFKTFKDITTNGIENAYSKYVETAYQEAELEFDDYIYLLTHGLHGVYNDKVEDLYNEYKKLFESLPPYKSLIQSKSYKNADVEEQDKLYKESIKEFIQEKEKEKLLYFMLSYNQQIIIIKSGEKKVEKEFLGYEFSNRRGYEGIKMYSDRSGKHTTKLYDMDNLFNEEKVNSYIHRAFLGEDLKNTNIPDNLKEHVFVKKLHNHINIDRLLFDKNISLDTKKKIKIETQWDLVPLGELCEVIKGVTYAKEDQVNEETNNVILTADNITLGGDFQITKKVFLNGDMKLDKKKKLKSNDIFMCFSSGSISHLGKVAYIYQNTEYYAGGFMGILRVKDKINSKYLYFVLNSPDFRELVRQEGTGSNINNLSSTMNSIKIPLPPMEIQEKVVAEIGIIEQEYDLLEKQISNEYSKINTVLHINMENQKSVKLGDIQTLLKRGKSTKYGHSDIQVIKSGQARGYDEFDFSERHYAVETFLSDERNLQIGDLLINSSGVGTAGRVTLFNLEGSYVADSHITILRLDHSKVVPKYVLYALADFGFKNIEELAKGQSGQIELSIPTVESIKIPLPTIESQRKIVKLIEEIEITIKSLKEKEKALKFNQSLVLQNNF